MSALRVWASGVLATIRGAGVVRLQLKEAQARLAALQDEKLRMWQRKYALETCLQDIYASHGAGKDLALARKIGDAISANKP